MVGYWLATHGRNLPMPIKRGVADAARRLYNERAVLRYDGVSRQTRMADVLELTHPAPRDAKQSALFKYLLDRRHRGDAIANPAVLPMLDATAALDAVPADERRVLLRERGPARRRGRAVGGLGGSRHVRPHGHRRVVRPASSPARRDVHG
jgi:hypothetical protein